MKKHAPLSALMVLAFASVVFAQAPSASPTPMPKQETAVPAPETSPPSVEELSANEKKLWEAWKNKQAGPFEAALSADTVMVSESGVAGKAEALQGVTSADCEVKGYELSDFKMTMIDKEVALLTYKGTQTGTCGGKALPATVIASSVWVRRGGKWWAAFHQETPGT